VEATYNWEPEAEKLIALYRQLIPDIQQANHS
jgi:hypothetical protein